MYILTTAQIAIQKDSQKPCNIAKITFSQITGQMKATSKTIMVELFQ